MASLRKLRGLLVVVLLCAIPFTAHAKLFRNAYVQFELPDNWDCNLEGTEWVCSSRNKVDAKESIIILTSKEVGPQDTFASYEDYLKKPKDVPTAGGKIVKSQLKNVKTRKINDHQWVDAMHLGSEIPGYYTRYLATIKDKLAILVTLSAHQKYYTKYANDYLRAVESLRVVASKDLLNPKAFAPTKPGGETVGPNTPTTLPPDNEPPAPESSSSGPDAATLGGIILIVAAVVFYLMRKRKS
jgi:hypothetical protein